MHSHVSTVGGFVMSMICIRIRDFMAKLRLPLWAALPLLLMSGGAESQGRPLIIGVPTAPASLNSALAVQLEGAIIGAQLFASPLKYASTGYKLEPYLAKSWSVSRDGREVKLILADGATFHDGNPITSDDVRFSIETVKKYNPTLAETWSKLAAVEVPDAKTVVIKFTKPMPAMLTALAAPLLPIIPKHIYGDVENMRLHPRNSKDVVGSGPFKLVSYEPGKQANLARFERFFIANKPMADSLIIRVIGDPTAYAIALETGQIDISASTNLQMYRKFKGDGKKIRVYDQGYEALGTEIWMEMNTKDKILSQAPVRQAIAYAIDKAKLIARGDGLFKRTPSMIDPTNDFYNEKVNHYELDIDRASKLLDAAGYPNTDGTRFNLTLDYLPGVDVYLNMAHSIQADLAKVGIRVNLRATPDIQSWAKSISNFDYQLNIDSVWTFADPTLGATAPFLCSNVRKGVMWANMTQYCNLKVDQLFESAATEMDHDKRRQTYYEAQRIIVDDAPMVFLHTRGTTASVNARVKNLAMGVWGLAAPLLDARVE